MSVSILLFCSVEHVYKYNKIYTKLMQIYCFTSTLGVDKH